jgi:pimeloyl-ACP methyl ester carboxylesterase
MTEITRRRVPVNGVELEIEEAGEGPVVLLLHGFLNIGHSWRHQLRALAEAGYHAVAPDQRGYGDSSAPVGAEHYTSLHLVGDVLALLDLLGDPAPVIVGHDWGAMIAWQTALLRPDRVRGVAGVSVPYVPRGELSMLAGLRARFGDRYYMQYFQEVGPADAELARDVEATLRSVLYSGSGEAPRLWDPVIPEGGAWLDVLPDPGRLPSWITADDFAVHVAAFSRSGFTGPLNWYRAIDLSWELMAAWRDARILVPGLFVYGVKDAFPTYSMALIESLGSRVPDLRGVVALDGVGHWVQQEAPDAVTSALLGFLRGL